MSRFQITTVRRTVLVWTLGIGAALADEKPPPIKVGQATPEIAFQKLLQAPEGAQVTREALKGQVVVLEFWATWCKGCVEAIPHMNELSEKFAGKPVRFIAVTAEEESKVLKFMEKRPIKGWIGLDSKKSMSRAFGAVMIPHTVLIDREGKIAGVTSPEQLTEQHLNHLLGGKQVQFKSERALFLEEYIQEVQLYDKVPEDQRLFVLSIQPVKSSNKGGAGGPPGDYRATNTSLRLVLATAYDVPYDRVEGSSSILDQTFSVRFRAPSVSLDRAARMLQDALCAALCLTMRRETRDVEVYVLTLPDAPGPGLKPPSPPKERGGGSNPQRINVKDQTLESLVTWLENQTKEPVFDETGLKGRFDYELKWDKDNPKNTFKEIEEKFGVKVTRMKRPVEFLVMKDAQD